MANAACGGMICAGLCVGMALAAQAKTVAWYRFEDQTLGTTAPAQVVVTNSAESGVHDALPRTINATTLDALGSEAAAYMPVYEASSPAGYWVYDPVTQTHHANGGGMRFKSNGSAGGASKAGFLMVEDSEALRAITNLTLEAFVKIPPTSEDPIVGSYARPILIKTYQAYQATWCMQVFESDIFYRATAVHADGVTTSTMSGGNGSKTGKLDDNRWHHVAVVYDFGEHKVRIYVDYAVVFNGGINANAVGFYHPDNSPLVIGGNTQHTRRMNGWLDEVRISDEALSPDRFLRFKPLREVDADTVAHLTFDDGLAPWFSAKALPVNAATNAPWTVTVDAVAGVEAPYATNKVFGVNVRSGAYTPMESANLGSLFAVTNGASGGTTMLLNDSQAEINHGSYTLEAVFKTNGQTSKHPSSQYQNSFCLFNSNYMKVLMNGENGQTLFRLQDQKEKYTARVDDEGWHHLAFVFDAATSNLFGYIDYDLKVTLTDVTNIVTKTGSLRIGGNSKDWQVFSGCLDEVRVTRRALKPVEFLVTGRAIGEASLLADFEGDLSANSNPSLVRDGTGSARTGGQVPTLSPVVPGRRIARDGVALQDRVSNTRSLRIDGGRMNWVEKGPLEVPSFTLEFFAKFESTAQYANLFRFNHGTDADGTPTWAWWQVDNDGKSWGFRAEMLQSDGTVTVDDRGPNLDATVNDNKWHHWAIQADYGSGTDTVFRIYRDYEQVYTKTLLGRLAYGNPQGMLTIGGTSQSGAHIHGWYDEVRFTRAVLPPDQFQRVFPTGTSILVR